ncbi:SAM-dependent methyltransferase [Saccharothrix tamanrassetensis]|uniref:SAM-dependent methyltransferase n=1 Tax=Saccharothrix tamanrassetensis TaxID=1051531 RepID=A0A841CBW0_9PSEU|nr:class I SAM-dependent methyltransferase [Saccharothrix tamanrassetensis]MBB5953658.1 SAM-dependent methyltransferase [Saccharothrix tamanrassetensis]
MRHDPYGTGVLSKDNPLEDNRLLLLERALDPVSRSAVEGLPLPDAPRCLDLAAGRGSVAYWLARRFPRGEVVAADIDPRYLDEDAAPNLRVLAFDAREDRFPAGSFDLVHTRSALKHLPEREEVLAELVRWIAPGGWLVTVDGYWFPSDETANPGWAKVVQAVVDRMNAQGGDMRWTRRLPALVARLGLADVSVRLAPSLAGWDGWGEQHHEWLRATVEQIGPVLVADGLLAEDDLARFHATPDGRDMAEWFGLVAAVVGRVP